MLSNKGEEAVKRLPHGLYGVSNASLDTPWTKVDFSACSRCSQDIFSRVRGLLNNEDGSQTNHVLRGPY